MAFGSGSSFSTDCSMRLRGSPASLKLCRAGLASLLNQLSFRKPTTHSGRPASLARLINRSLAKPAFFLAYSGSGEVPGSSPHGRALLSTAPSSARTSAPSKQEHEHNGDGKDRPCYHTPGHPGGRRLRP